MSPGQHGIRAGLLAILASCGPDALVVEAPQLTWGAPPWSIKPLDTQSCFLGIPPHTWLPATGAPGSDGITVDFDVEGRTLSLGSSLFDLEFWPTEVLPLRGQRLLVCGKRDGRGGYRTVIEIWDVNRTPEYPGTQRPPILSRETVYDVAMPGRDMVALAFENQRDPNRCFVKFWDSQDLYDLDFRGSSPPRLVLASESGRGAEVQPKLTREFGIVIPMDHIELGDIYVLYCLDGESPMMLCDADRDGNLDPGTSLDLDDSVEFPFDRSDPSTFHSMEAPAHRFPHKD